MAKLNVFDSTQLRSQIALQTSHGWAPEIIPFSQGIDLSKSFLPLDQDNLFFPNASAEQRLALSQLFGLIVNETITEMECSMPRLKYLGWELLLKRFPVNPEMFELGELFFAEEEKHAQTFKKYFDLFSKETGIEPHDLSSLLPKAFNSRFQQAIIHNAEHGGHAFWWVVANVEDVSIQVFREIAKSKKEVDPLFFELHKRHAEEEARHDNYAFLMLDAAHRSLPGIRGQLFAKKDLLLAQAVSTPWLLTELTKIFRVKHLKHKHPWFDVLASTLPLLESLPKIEMTRKVFLTAPYIGWLLNPKFHKKSNREASKHGALSLAAS